MRYQREVILFVGLFGNRQQLLAAFSGRGYSCVNVYAPVLLSHMKEEDYSLCRENICYNGNLSILMQTLSKFRIRAVIPCIEVLLPLAERLAELLHVAGNSSMTSQYRCNKYWMNEVLRQKGIPCLQQSRPSNRIEPLLEWYRNSGFTQVVSKPLWGALSVGVSICHSENDLRQGFQLNKGNGYYGYMDEFIVQEFIMGAHFWVNTVSCAGKHFTANIVADVEESIQEYYHGFGRLLYRQETLFQEAEAYTHAVLDAIEMNYGAAHTEIRLTTEGWRLIEVNPRLSGGLFAGTVESFCGYSQTSVLVDAVLEPNLFTKRCALYKTYPDKEAIFIYMVNPETFTMQREADVSVFCDHMETFSGLYFAYNIGEIVPKTVNTVTVPGYVMLLGALGTNWQAELEYFRKLETVFYQQIQSI
jgi:biotin carboxylase